MSLHETIDNLSIRMGSVYGEKMQFFREGIESSSLTDIVQNLEVEFISPEGEGEYEVPVRYGDLHGMARYNLINWSGGESPCLIYHHGSA